MTQLIGYYLVWILWLIIYLIPVLINAQTEAFYVINTLSSLALVIGYIWIDKRCIGNICFKTMLIMLSLLTMVYGSYSLIANIDYSTASNFINHYDNHARIINLAEAMILCIGTALGLILDGVHRFRFSFTKYFIYPIFAVFGLQIRSENIQRS